MNIVILAGGQGTRLWPMSRKGRAKQFNEIVGAKTMLEMTLDRFLNTYPKEKLFISVTPEDEALVQKILPDFPQENIIVEPEMRDTAAAMGYVAAFLYNLFPDEPLAFVASDHFIRHNDQFLATLKAAEEVIKETGKLVDIGVVPDCPSTALGYTKIGKKVDEKEGVKIYEFLGHREKPGYKQAQEYFNSGKYFWHANFYMWTPRLFLEAFKKHAPEIWARLEVIRRLLKEKGCKKKIAKEYSKIERVMIDYAVTEKMKKGEVLIMKGEFGWSDIGSWNVLHKKLAGASADEKGNLVKGEWVGLDTSNSLVYVHPDKVIATIGVDDMVIVDTPDALLICPKGRAQDVKQIVEQLREQKKDKYL